MRHFSGGNVRYPTVGIVMMRVVLWLSMTKMALPYINGLTPCHFQRSTSDKDDEEISISFVLILYL